MRKLTVIAALSVMLFAVGAFAASFQVGDTVLASASADVTACQDSATIEYGTGYTPDPEREFIVTEFVATFNGTGCDGLFVHIVVNNTPWASGVPGNNFAIGQVSGDSVTFAASPTASPTGYPLVSDITNVSLLVKETLTTGEFVGYSSGLFGANLTPTP